MRITCSFNKVIILISGICWAQVSAQTISWSNIDGPYSGSIQVLTVDTFGNIFTSTSAGMYRSTDAGENWQALGLSFEFGVSFLVADSADNVYAGIGAEGLYESTDNGTSWAKSSLTGNVNSAAVLSGNRICIGGLQTVSISSDGGKSWSASQVTTDSRIDVLSVAEDNSGNLYAGLIAYQPRPPAPSYGGGIYISSDSGKTWGFYGMETTSVASITVNKQGKVFILEPPTSAKELGIIWSLAPTSSTWTEDVSGIPYWVNSLQTLFTDNVGEAAVVTDMGIFVYDYSTSSWKSVTPAISLSSITSAIYNPNGTSYAGTSTDGVFSLRNSSSAWVQCGIVPASITSIGFDGSGNLFAGTGDGVFEQSLQGWLRVSNGLSRSMVYQLYFSASSKRLYASTEEGLSYLPDSGNYWTPLTKVGTYDLLESPDSNDYAGTAGGILKAVDGQDIWNIVQTIGIPITNIYCLAADSINDLFAGTSYDGIFISTDGGTFWTQGGISSPLIFCSVKTIGVDHHGRIFAGTDTAGAYYSDDQGANWNGIPSITGKSITCFLVNNPSMYFAGTSDHGAFVSTDGGVNWYSADNGLTDSTIISVNVDQQGHFYAGTENGLFMSTGTPTRVDGKNEAPSSFSLFQNYPNPFNPATVIRYQLSVNSLVTLKVYDVLGRVVKTLIEERQAPGTHSITFDASSLSSGVYLYRLAAGNFVDAKKMILLK
ncbi:MAG: T9SS type A sorting domain-containing protein [Bacteroidota bacterium]